MHKAIKPQNPVDSIVGLQKNDGSVLLVPVESKVPIPQQMPSMGPPDPTTVIMAITAFIAVLSRFMR
jgi:Ni,Fe-hydrogenase III small subunit